MINIYVFHASFDEVLVVSVRFKVQLIQVKIIDILYRKKERKRRLIEIND